MLLASAKKDNDVTSVTNIYYANLFIYVLTVIIIMSIIYSIDNKLIISFLQKRTMIPFMKSLFKNHQLFLIH